jgi:integrase
MGKRGPGEGSVFKRKDRDLWQGLVTVGHDANGKRIRKPVFGKTKSECVAKKKELENQVLAGAAPISGRLTVEQLIARWIKDKCEKSLKRSTVASYKGIAKNHINPLIGRVKLSKLKAAHIASVLSTMEENELAGSTRKHAYTILNSALKWAIKMDLASVNPCAKITPPKPEQTEQDVYTAEELKRFLKAAKGNRLEAVFILAATTGARQGEILGLKWEDIDLDNSRLSIRRKIIEIGGHIYIEEPKTKKSRRQIDLPQMAVQALIEHRKRMLKEGYAGAGWVFPSTNGEPIRRQSFNLWAHQPIHVTAKLRYIPFKNLRHSHATALLSSGEHPKVVQERLGHSRISTTMDVYSHVTPTMQADAARKMNDLLSETG